MYKADYAAFSRAVNALTLHHFHNFMKPIEFLWYLLRSILTAFPY